MPVTKFTIPDSSPWVTYEGSWGDSDVGTISYNNGTFHFTRDIRAKATITFNGTGIELFGAKRHNHGMYKVIFNGTSFPAVNGSSAPVYGSSLYAVAGLPLGQHTVTLANAEADKFVDLDYAQIEIGEGDSSTSGTDFWMDDTHPNITYLDFLVASNANPEEWYNGTSHLTSSGSGKAMINFHGNSVSLYGSTSNDHGLYGVTLDSGPQQTFSGRIDKPNTFRSRQLLYLASNLPPGPHQVELTNFASGANFDFDYAIVTTYGSSKTTASPTTSATSTTDPKTVVRSKNSVGAIVGGVVGSVVSLAILGVLVCLFLRHRRQRDRDHFVAERKKAAEALGQEFVPDSGISNGASPSGLHGEGALPGHANARSPAPHIGGSLGAVTDAQSRKGSGGKQGTYGQHQHSHNNQGMFEKDMPPPNYNHVFSPVMSNPDGVGVSGSVAEGSSGQKSHVSAGGAALRAPSRQDEVHYMALPNPHDPRIC